MFSSKLASAKTKAAGSSDSKLAPQRSTFATRPTNVGDAIAIACAPFPPRSVGSQATFRLLTLPLSSPEKKPRISQFKRVVGEVNDPLEHEADRVAKEVVRTHAPRIRIAAISPEVTRKYVEHENENGKANTLPLKPVGTSHAATGDASDIVDETLRTPGQPLEPSVRSFFEPRFGYDFSKVRVHSDKHAAESARALRARAFTSGRHIVFGAGECAPETPAGRLLLAHELTHVVQQSTHGEAPVRRKEVATEVEIQGKQDWTTADREGETARWRTACQTNLDAVDTTQYVRVVERRDFYKWFYHYTAALGFNTRWALAAYVVAKSADLIANMDASHAIANDIFSMANVELEGAMREGNQIIFDNVLPKLKKLVDGGPLKGPAALKWDSEVLAQEQALVQPMYKLMSPETVKQMDSIARKEGMARIGAWYTEGDKIKGDEYTKADTVPPFDEKNKGNLQSVGDRWQYGMERSKK